MLHQLLHVLKCKDFAAGREQELAHVFVAYSKSTPGDTGEAMTSNAG